MSSANDGLICWDTTGLTVVVHMLTIHIGQPGLTIPLRGFAENRSLFANLYVFLCHQQSTGIEYVWYFVPCLPWGIISTI